MQNEASQSVHMVTWAIHLCLLSPSIKYVCVELCLSLLAASNLFIKFAVYGGTTGHHCKPAFSPSFPNILVFFRKKKRGRNRGVGKQVGEGGKKRAITCQASACSPENTVKWSGMAPMLISKEMRNEPALALRLINGKITPHSRLMK